jgi:ABC-type multidrug transport system ATPase subunit
MRLKLSLREVSKSYGNINVLNKCSQSFGPGLTAVIGPSQSGKTTMMKICANIEPATSGRVSYFYSSERSVKDEQYVMRKVTLVLPFGTIFNTTAWKNVTSGLIIRRKKGREIRKLATEILNTVDLYEKRNRNAFALSRGECRRLLLARALVINPDVLLLDEPFRGLDDKSSEIIEKILLDLKASDDPPTIVMTTSDPLQAASIADKRLLIKRGTFAVSVSVERETEPELEIPGHIDIDKLDMVEEKEGGTKPFINPEFFKE